MALALALTIDHHDYQLYLAINDIDHAKTKAISPQTDGICERFHKTILNEFYQIIFRKKLYSTMEELQKDLDDNSSRKDVLWANADGLNIPHHSGH